jgi:uncharacterized protein (TIGR04222 family)
MSQAHQALWTKISNFTFDDGTAVNSFAKKLAAEQGWTPEFTQRAIEEYKKFMLLCCISPIGAAPSQTVDEVWHLHLTYTRSYWIDFCQGVLEKDIHHHPSAGGAREDDKHLAWYKSTRQFYENTFNTAPPEDIWPTPIEDVQVPGYPPVKWTQKLAVWCGFLALLPFLFSGLVYGQLFPYYLEGRQFVWFFVVFASCLLIIYAIYLQKSHEQANNLLTDYFPEDASPFQIAAFVYGKGRAVQTGIVDLIKRGLLLPEGDQGFGVKKSEYTPRLNDLNPLIAGFELENDQAVVNYMDIYNRWYTASVASHPLFVAMDKFATQRRPFITLLLTILYTVPTLRLIQGLVNHKPTAFLILEIIVAFFIARLMDKGWRRDLSMYKKAKEVYQAKYNDADPAVDMIVPRFAMKGLSAVSGFAETAILVGMFAPFSVATFRNTYGDQENKDYGGASGCGSSGSSCSGSSCSGGSCGGGGCGGCGGGGD